MLEVDGSDEIEVVVRLVSVFDESFVFEVRVSSDGDSDMGMPLAVPPAVWATLADAEVWADAVTLTHVPDAPPGWRLVQ